MSVLFAPVESGRAQVSQFWCETKDGDPLAYALYRRHYSSAKNKRPKIRQFVGPGESLVLIGLDGDALFVWRRFIDLCIDERTGLPQQGVNCSVFRNESPALSSDMILDAQWLAWQRWPGERLYTTIDAQKVRSTNPGYCFQMAGWWKCGETKGGLVILERLPA